MRAERGDHPGSEGGPQFQDRPLVGQQLERAPHVVDPAPVGWHHVAQECLVGTGPVAHVALEVRQVAAADLDGFLLVVAEDIDHPVAHLHRRRPHVLGGEHAESATLDHGRASHPDGGVRRGDDDVAAAEQRRVACEAAARHDADERHAPAQRAEERERFGIEPGHRGGVGVAGTAAPAFCEEDDREAEPVHQCEEAVLLLVVHLALGPGQDRIVVRQHGTASSLVAEEMPVHPADACDEAVGGRVGAQVVLVAAGALGGYDEGAVLLEAAGVAQVLDVLARRAAAGGVPAFGGSGAARIEGRRLAGTHYRQLRPFGLRARVGAFGEVAGARRTIKRRRVERARSDGQEEVPGLHGIAGGHRHRVDPARRGGLDHMLHLHGLEHDEDRARRHGVAGRHLDAQDGAGEGGRDVGGCRQPGHRGSGTEKPTSPPQALR